ncbi:MAG: DUF962 domain-containing protein [Rhodospirillales bacterium]
MARKYERYSDFWPFYLGEHSRALTRLIHVTGTGCGLLLLVIGLVTQTWWLLPAALVCGYAFAWLSHLLVERNRPATFTYPLWSLYSDFRMFALFCGGKLDDELKRHGIAQQ